jgi:hypothetical protein
MSNPNAIDIVHPAPKPPVYAIKSPVAAEGATYVTVDGLFTLAGLRGLIRDLERAAAGAERQIEAQRGREGARFHAEDGLAVPAAARREAAAEAGCY